MSLRGVFLSCTMIWKWQRENIIWREGVEDSQAEHREEQSFAIYNGEKGLGGTVIATCTPVSKLSDQMHSSERILKQLARMGEQCFV